MGVPRARVLQTARATTTEGLTRLDIPIANFDEALTDAASGGDPPRGPRGGWFGRTIEGHPDPDEEFWSKHWAQKNGEFKDGLGENGEGGAIKNLIKESVQRCLDNTYDAIMRKDAWMVRLGVKVANKKKVFEKETPAWQAEEKADAALKLAEDLVGYWLEAQT